MHALHLLAVEAEDKDEALELVDTYLEPFGDGLVWDWWAVGGRWEGYFENGASKENVLCYAEDEEKFRNNLLRIDEAQDRVFKRLIEKVFGLEPSPSTIVDFFGQELSEEQKVARANREFEDNKRFKAAFDRLKEGRPIWDRSLYNQDQRLGYVLKDLGDCILRRYNSESGFWDGLEYTTSVRPTLERCTEDPNNQFLVAVDLHF